ncbi:hypothetical protein [Protaetiibacter mangrovi]|uniref:VWFA domain-containing protein n=1 Tax=Protaetiibacter mangrovi TaxID=2970926 RepID=A0ABT1ZET5_9MICO|nr:hypothetical protein [Protaetiibacter mangrovi]MCS0499189.1 hypothetical protein [Protaetiibacter mangrovi]
MKRALAFVTTTALAILMSVGFASGASAAGGYELTSIAKGGVEDLRQCLASSDTLDVFYLIDSSGSMKDTDSGIVRADLLANSLRELAGLKEGLTLNYAASFFSTRYLPEIDWVDGITAADVDAQADALANAIRARPPAGSTNWLQAVTSAQSSVAAQHQKTNGCQALIWLTDGGIWVGDNSVSANATALNSMCGAPLVAGGAAPDPTSRGTFSEMRQAGVIVFGVMLRDESVRDTQSEYVKFMRPLVEGQDGDMNCGEYPDGHDERYVSGVYLQAANAGDLARVFLRLGALVAGGAESPFGPDGEFPVDAGVASFSIVTDNGSWRLTAPDGSVVTAANADAAGFDVDQSGQAVRLTLRAVRTSDIGTWKLDTRTDTDSLLYSSGLRLALDPGGTFVAGSDYELTGRVVREGADLTALPVALDANEYTPRVGYVSPSGLIAVELKEVHIDPTGGDFSFTLSTADVPPGSATFTVSLTDVSSSAAHIPLADVSVKMQVEVTVPGDYPSIAAVELSDLNGSDGVASGALTIVPPTEQPSGSVCFPAGVTPIVDSDSADRYTSWVWGGLKELELDSGGCLTVTSPIDVTLTAANPDAANSKVAAHLDVIYKTSSGDELPGSVPISFVTTRPVNGAAFAVLMVGLLLAGLLLPLVALWIFSWLFTRITRGSHLHRASVPVRIDASGRMTTEDGRPLAKRDWSLDDFPFHSKQPDSRRFSDPQLGTFRGRVPWNPFSRPWYQVAAREGMVLFGPGGYLPRSLSQKRAAGRVLGLSGDLGRVWAVTMAAATLSTLRDDPVAATLVVFLRNETGDKSAYRERIAKLASDGSLERQLTAAREAVAAELSANSTKTTSGAAQKAQAGATETGAAPRRNDGMPDSEPPRRQRGAEAAEPPRRSSSSDGHPPRRGVSGDGGRSSHPDVSPRSGGGTSASDPNEPPRRTPAPSDPGEPPRRSR